MGIQFISGFRGLDHAKQHLRRSTHLGSATTSGSTVLNPSEAFDQQACFVYLNGAMLREGTSGDGGDYVLSGTNTITFNTAVAATDVIEVVSFAFQNSTLPQTLKEVDYAITSTNATAHATSRVTDGDYDTSADTLIKSSHGLVVGDVINVISATPTSGTTITAGRYKVLTVTDSGNVVLTDIDGNALAFANDSDADVTYDIVFSLSVPNLTVVNHAMVYLNGMLLVEDTDYFRDQQQITLDKTVNIATGHQIAIRHFGSYVTAADGEVQRTGITITDDTHNLLLSSSDLVNSTTATFHLQVSVRHVTATNDAYRIANLFVRAEKAVPADCYLHLVADAGNIATGHQLAIRSFGSFALEREAEKQETGITVVDDTHNILIQSSDLVSNTTTTFQLQVSVRHVTATNDAYRIANFFVRAEKAVPADCYLHTIADAGNIASTFEVLDENGYSAASDMTDGNVGVGITADASGWYVYLANRAGYSIVAGFKASAISN